eukprot:gene18263-20083_t
MADNETDPGCGPVLQSNYDKDESKPYPTNTYTPPSHVPGKKTAPSNPQGQPFVDHSKFDIVKAAQYGILERCRQLVEEEGIDVRVPDVENVTALHWASINNKVPVMEYFISKGAVVDQKGGNLNATPLHWAVRQGHIDAVVLLMKHGADPTLQDSEGCGGLHLAAQFGHTSIVAYLLAKNVDVDHVDQNGMTPLMWAAYRSFGIETIRVLLNFGASVNYADKVHRNTALHWAIASSNTNSIKPLLKSGAKLDLLNEQGLLPIDLATERRNGWIIHTLESATSIPSGGRSFFRSFTTDKDKKRKMGIIVPTVAMFAAGFILEYSPWWLYTVTLLAGLGFALNFVLRKLSKLQKLGCYETLANFAPRVCFLSTIPSRVVVLGIPTKLGILISCRFVAQSDQSTAQCVTNVLQGWITIVLGLITASVTKTITTSSDFNANCGPFEKGILTSIVSICECAPWVTWGYVHALFHGFWVGALLVCNCYQLFWLGMTTNERMNSPRYQHFHDGKTGKIQSPFARGVVQNIADFFECSIFGLVKPNRVDWMSQYDVSNFAQGQHQSRRMYDNVV